MLVITVFAENFGGGLGTAAFMALVMSLCNPRFNGDAICLDQCSGGGRESICRALSWNNGRECRLGRIFPMDGGLCLTRFIVVVGGLRPTIHEYEALQDKEMTPVALEEAKVNA